MGFLHFSSARQTSNNSNSSMVYPLKLQISNKPIKVINSNNSSINFRNPAHSLHTNPFQSSIPNKAPTTQTGLILFRTQRNKSNAFLKHVIAKKTKGRDCNFTLNESLKTVSSSVMVASESSSSKFSSSQRRGSRKEGDCLCVALAEGVRRR